MSRLCTCFLIFRLLCGAANDPADLLQHIRDAVAAQLAKAANYTCVQTIDRSYFQAETNLPGCAIMPNGMPEKPFLHDRLRLDVAVSQSNEIYSWHGENKFSTTRVSEVVRKGPISSGNFVGFLHNVFLVPGVQFTYKGTSDVNGTTIHNFNFAVPVASSGYHVLGPHGTPTVPFHGSFTVNAADYQLKSLKVIADSIPSDTKICYTETEVTYQLVNISGNASLIPAAFVLRVEDETHVGTVSRSEYSQCREFRGESTLRFDLVNAPAEAAASLPASDEWLPSGITLRVALREPIDDRVSYTGDPVEGVLLNPVPIAGMKQIIPKNALLHGIITKLEYHEKPWKHHLVSIQFDRVIYGGASYALRATPKTRKKDIQNLIDIYGGRLPFMISEDTEKGVFVITSSHVHLDSHFSSEWVTGRRPEEKSASAPRQSQVP
jgi:hypothetical protein